MADSNYVPQIDYTSRDYASIRDDLYNLIPLFAPEWTTRDPADLGIAILEIFAHMGDMLNYYVDRAANEAFLSTASQRDSVLKIAQMLGYVPTDTTPASVTLTFVNSTTSVITVPAGTQVSGTNVVNAQNVQIIFETSSDALVPAKVGGISGTATVTAIQGETIVEQLQPASDGTANQYFTLAQQPVIQDSIGLVINGTSYNHVTYLIESSGTDPVFTSNTDADGITSVTFGDGVAGRIPPSNAIIYATYRTGGGVSGNVNAGTITSILTNQHSGLTVFNQSAASGGADAETTDSIRVNAPLSVSTASRAVSLKDYASLSTQVTGVAKASAQATVFTNVNLYIAPFGDTGVDNAGNLSTIFKTIAAKLNTFFLDKAPPSVSLTFLPPTFVGVNIQITVTALPQYKQSTVQVGVTKAINELLAFDNVSFADRIGLHDIMSIVAGVTGVNYSQLSLLARADSVNQTGVTDLQFAFNEIPQAGTVTVAVTGGIVG
jgi:hypothetical protein